VSTSSGSTDGSFQQRRSGLLQQVFDLPETQRLAWIHTACAGDTQLERELQRLVEADGQPHPLLDASAIDLAADWLIEDDTSHADSLVGHTVGAYRLVRLLGEGGMGSVWEAERIDQAFVATVAVKLLRHGMDSAALRARFQRERELLARLAHPYIARLYDAGVSATGQTYFVMERIEGVPLQEFLRTQRPGLRERLRLFAQLCQAVAHAHSRLVIHRDVKPSNLLVRADGSPVLLDFGIAKAVDAAQATQTQQRFLTPAYAAPEQWRGELATTATDIYSLGVVLFELLSGRAYHVAGKGRESTRLPRQGEIAIARHLRRDIDTVVAKALAPEPIERYATAQALAEDVQRILDGRPILARAEHVLYRIAKFAYRNPLATVFAVCLAILGSVVVAAELNAHWQAVQQASRVAGMRDLALSGLARADAAPPDHRGARSILPLLMDDPTAGRRDAARLRARTYLALADGFTQLGRHEEAYRNVALAVESLQAASSPTAVEEDPVAVELSGLSAAAQASPDPPSSSLSMAQWLAQRSTGEGCATP